MTRSQSIIGIVTVLVCLAVGISASQRPPLPELLAEIPPSKRLVVAEEPSVTKLDPDDELISSVLNDEHQPDHPAVIPRKLSVGEERPVVDHPVRRLIARELPDASDEEREVWFEELQHLPLSAVEDVLKVRRQTAPLTGPPDTIAPQKISPTTPCDERRSPALSPGTRDALRQYRSLILLNLLNGETVGYRSVEPQLGAFPAVIDTSRTSAVEGLRWIGSRLSLKQGTFDVTDRPLDLAIAGTGWFVVTADEGKLAFTRNGAFEINEQRTLELMTAVGPRAVDPPISFPDGVVQVFVDSKGQIYGRSDGQTFNEAPVIGQIQLARFFDDSALQLSEDGLYRPLPKAGAMVRHTPGESCGSLREGMLEHSNVNVESQQQALRRIEQWLVMPLEIPAGP